MYAVVVVVLKKVTESLGIPKNSCPAFSSNPVQKQRTWYLRLLL